MTFFFFFFLFFCFFVFWFLRKNKKCQQKKNENLLVRRETQKNLNLYLNLTEDSDILYILISQNEKRTYCGISTFFPRRYRQHIGLIKGGARATKYKKDIPNPTLCPWIPVCIISGWNSKLISIRSIEWKMHHPILTSEFKTWKNQLSVIYPEWFKKQYGIEYRLLNLYFYLYQSIQKCPSLQITWFQSQFRNSKLWSLSTFKEHFALYEDVFQPIIFEYKNKKMDISSNLNIQIKKTKLLTHSKKKRIK